MTQVVLIRSGATAYDEQNRVQGILDIPLSERGRAEVAQLAEKLARAEPSALALAALYCGPGESVVRTAEIVGKAIGLRPRRIDDLHNRIFQASIVLGGALFGVIATLLGMVAAVVTRL